MSDAVRIFEVPVNGQVAIVAAKVVSVRPMGGGLVQLDFGADDWERVVGDFEEVVEWVARWYAPLTTGVVER